MKMTSKFYLFLLSFLTILSLAGIPAPTGSAIPVTGLSSLSIIANATSPSVQSAKESASNSQLASIKIENVFDLPVVQQPSSNSGYVSTRNNTLTQFGLASRYGSIGILAHNYLAGKYFSSLSSGEVITLTFADGTTKNYTVSSIKQYQALTPDSQYSKFVDLNDYSKTLSSSDLFMDTFGLSDALVLQTCITKNGNSSWGRLFVIAYAS